MAGKSSAGFTKAAQAHKFVRHRDVKMKDSELRRESHIQHEMCVGLCTKCREKVQWRFQFDKYKPLTKPATCQRCKNKTVHKAYRSLCEPCSTTHKECPACCKDIEQTNEELQRAREASGRASAAAAEGDGEGEGDDDDDDELNAMEDEEAAEEEKLRKKMTSAARPASESASGVMDVEKSERELQRMAATKYSKTRMTGSTEDRDNVFGFAAPSL